MPRTKGTSPKAAHGPAKGASVHGPAKGASVWGGAKGSPEHKPAFPPFVPGNTVAAVVTAKDRAKRAARKLLMEQKADYADDFIFDVISTAPDIATRFNAAKAFREIVYGKPRQAVEMTGADGEPLKTGITVTFVKPGNQ